MSYNSMGFLGFSVNHITEDPYLSVTADDVRKAIIKKLAEYSDDDDDFLSVVELTDTYKEDKDGV